MRNLSHVWKRCGAGLALVLWASALASTAPGQTPRQTQSREPSGAEIAAVEQAVRASIGWALEKDRPLLESVIAHDAELFIFHPDSKSTVVGWDAFAKMFAIWMDPRFKAISFDVRDLRIRLSRDGGVAWYSATLDDLGEWDGRPIGWKDARWTGVLEKRDGRWVIVQMHFSLASDRPEPKASQEHPKGGGDAPVA